MADTKSETKPASEAKDAEKPKRELPPPGPDVLIYKPL